MTELAWVCRSRRKSFSVMRGLIEFESEPGRTVFMVRLPLTSPARSDVDG